MVALHDEEMGARLLSAERECGAAAGFDPGSKIYNPPVWDDIPEQDDPVGPYPPVLLVLAVADQDVRGSGGVRLNPEARGLQPKIVTERRGADQGGQCNPKVLTQCALLNFMFCLLN